jgi:hypothetical protein
MLFVIVGEQIANMPSNKIKSNSSRRIRDIADSIDDDGIGDAWLNDTSFYSITTSASRTRNTILRCDTPKAGNLPTTSITNKNQPPIPFHGPKNCRFRSFSRTFCCLCSLVVVFVALTGKAMKKQHETALFLDDHSSTRFDELPHHIGATTGSVRMYETPILFDTKHQGMKSVHEHDGHRETPPAAGGRASWATPSLYSKGTQTNPKTDTLYINATNHSRQILLLSRLHDFPTISGGLPFYLHIPKSAGSTMKAIFSECYHLVLASNVGVKPDMLPLHPPIEKGLLRLVQNKVGSIYVNVQTTTVPGLQWAKENNFSYSGLADVVSSHLFFPTLEYLFTSDSSRGKVFTILRHPIERALSTFYYLGSESSKHERNYNPFFKNLTIEEYLRSNKVESDWLTRKLNGDLRGRIRSEHVDHALEVLRTKFLIGLLSHMEESLRRFEIYFHWSDQHRTGDRDHYRETCIQNLVRAGGRNKNVDAEYQSYKEKVLLNPSSTDHNLLLQYNGNDMKLYMYAEQLFLQQKKIFL